MAAEALYLHIPFCRARCSYCDFESSVCPRNRFEARVLAYLAQLERRLDAFGEIGALDQVRTVYIGGGTPTVLRSRLAELARYIRRWCLPVEFTCEANPESFDDEMASALARAGVTRISLGVQSLNDVELDEIGRIHSAREALCALDAAKRAGLSVSCDLMCGLPRQTRRSWQRTLNAMIEAGPDHVSVYPLTVEEDTPLARRVEIDSSLIPDEDFQADCMEDARAAFSAAGMPPYEVASYARRGHACAHNMAYWTGVSYLGMGRSAASMFDRSSFDSCVHLFPKLDVPQDAERLRLVQMDDSAQAFDAEYLTKREAAAEDLMLAMRMTTGASPELLARARRSVGASALDSAIGRAVGEGLAELDAQGSLRPTERGWLMGNRLYGLMWGLAE